MEAKDDSAASSVAARIIASIAEKCDIDGVTFTVRASVGIALYPEDGRKAQELLKHADVAMYAAKQEKQGAVLFGQLPRE